MGPSLCPYQVIETSGVPLFSTFGTFLLQRYMVFGTFPSIDSTRFFPRVGQAFKRHATYAKIATQ